MKRIYLSAFVMIVFSFCALAGGYQVKLQGQKQTGMGLIGTPLSFGASSIFYNPGGLSFMDSKFSVSAGVNGIFANVAFEKEGTGNLFRTDNPLSTPFYIYGAANIGSNITVGLGVYTPYGSTTQWEEENEDGIPWAGRYIIHKISFSALFIQPTIAYKISDKLSLGAGFIYATGNVDLERSLNYNEHSMMKLEGSTSNIGFNAGLMYRPTTTISVGVNYRSKIDMKMEDGDADFTVPELVGTQIPEKNTFDATLPLPANLDIGISFQVTKQLLVAAEVDWVQWSTYETLDFTFQESGDVLNSSITKNYNDSWITRIGAQYELSEKLALRLGAYYDPSPVNDDYFNPETVSLNTIAWTAGLSYSPVEYLSIDLSYDQLNGLKSDKQLLDENGENQFSGTYKVITHIPGIGVSLNF